MARLATPVLALLVLLGVALPGTVVAAPPPPKVVLIVGPVAGLTDRYRALADQAADAASAFTPNVVRVYSPNATWPAVRRALQGASIVVYLGHGNGWPSRYRNALFPVTQNGFGLNPTAGAGDDGHQYFGEGRIAKEVKLARNAVVVLSHLCYASGNTEPGLPEGTFEEAKQRVDNYAAGFIAAGASAVIAEGHFGPAWYVRSLLGSNRSVERIWRSAPSNHGNVVGFDSQRAKGFMALMDPDSAAGGYYRSIVLRGGLKSGQTKAGATTVGAIAAPADPTLVGSGLSLGVPYLHERPVAGSKVGLWIPFTIAKRSKLPKLTIGVRWDPIEVTDNVPIAPESGSSANGAPTPAAPPSATPSPAPTPTPTPTAAGRRDIDVTSGPGGDTAPPPAATPSPTPNIDPKDPSLGDVLLVEPERLGSLVQPTRVTASKTRLKTSVRIPAKPGRYRLVITLHDGTGVAFDPETQAMVRGLLVRVTGAVDADYLVAPTRTATAAEPFTLPVGVANLGTTAWGSEASGTRRVGDFQAATNAVLVARWIPLAAGATAPPDANLPRSAAAAPATADLSVDLPPALAAGRVARVVVEGTAPAASGEYLLLLDVVTPELGSLAARGVEPMLVRVTVTDR